jgi:hypothetical protein
MLRRRHNRKDSFGHPRPKEEGSSEDDEDDNEDLQK